MQVTTIKLTSDLDPTCTQEDITLANHTARLSIGMTYTCHISDEAAGPKFVNKHIMQTCLCILHPLHPTFI